VPVFFGSDLSGIDAETTELRALAQAALEFGEAWECGQADDVVPEADGVLVARQAADGQAAACCRR
jgi:hypothetical protein